MKKIILLMVSCMSNSIITTEPCDAVYTTVMNRTLEDLRGSFYRVNIEQAKQYMLITKQQMDIELQIRTIERTALNSQISIPLRIPLNRYQECKVVNFDIRAPMADCNSVYTTQAQQALALTKTSQIQVDPKLAEEYLLLLKQDNDLDTQIQEFERTVFSGELVSLLRMPLQRYVDCNTVLGATAASRS